MLPLTPEVLKHAYDFLRVTAPFNAWNLPDGEDVAFRIIKARDRLGWYLCVDENHTIAISNACVGHTASLMAVMAHEMVHLHQRSAGMETSRSDHNAAFWKLAARVCKAHGFDPKMF